MASTAAPSGGVFGRLRTRWRQSCGFLVWHSHRNGLMPGRCQARGAGDAGVTAGRYDPEDAAPAGGTMDLDRRKQGFGLARLLAAGVLSAVFSVVLAAAAAAQDYPQ